ncbi:energy transducer TonB [Mucilaginibacter sp. AW1-3]
MKYIFLQLLFLFPFVLKAQTVTVTKHANTALNFKAIDVEPQFPGGTKAFNKYLSKNVIYPANATAQEMNGSVTLAMAIEKDGTITDIKIVNGLSEVMDRETVRLMTASPKWKPGVQRGQPIRVRYTFTINYAQIGDKRG